MKLKNNQDGIAHLAAILAVVVVVAIGVVGWKVWDNSKNEDTPKTVATETKETKKASDKTDDWYQFVSKNDEYSIELANGLSFIDAGDDSPWLSLSTSSLTPNGNQKAKVSKLEGGKDGVMGMYINWYETGTETKGFGVLQSSFKTESGLQVDKYLRVQDSAPAGGIGLEEGGKEYTYFVTKDAANLVITYGIAPNDAENVAIVEKMVKTVDLK